MVMYIVIGVAVVLLVLVLFTYNNLIQLRNKVKEAFSTMDVYLKKRYDLIPSLVDIVKGYAKHETDTLQEVTKMRVNAQKSDLNAAINNEMKIGDALQSLLVIVEKYPDLKANEHYAKLMEELTSVEDDIANSRKYYNGVVRIYNNKVEMFPSNIFAGLFGYKSKAMFEANAKERENVKVEF